jgi:hypothetical protein
MDNEILVEDKSAGMPTADQAQEALTYYDRVTARARAKAAEKRLIQEPQHLRAQENIRHCLIAYLALMKMHEAKVKAETGHEHLQLTRCRSCQAGIVWLKTRSGKNMPVDAETFTQGEPAIFNPELGHISHFATCPNADKHRRKN